MTPWKLEVDFNTQNHLFYNKLNVNYIINVFVCSCGTSKIITAHKNQDMNFLCQECDNTNFYDVSEILLSVQNFIYRYKDIQLLYNFDIQYTPQKTTSRYSVDVPYDVDFLQEKVLYKTITVASYSFDNNLNIDKYYIIDYDEKLFELLNTKLVEYISKNTKAYNIPTHNKVIKYSLNIASFFLSYPHFKEFDFYYWKDIEFIYQQDITIQKALGMIANNRKEKSIKKAVHRNYIEQLSKNKRYFNKLITLFTSVVEDSNIVIQYIDLEICSAEFSKINMTNIISLVPFLKQHYTDKQILNMLKSIRTREDENIFIDLLNSYSYTQDLLGEFIKNKCSLRNLHDEFVRLSSTYYFKKIYSQTLTYTEDERKKEKYFDEYQISLPNNGKELLSWANTLHNCLASYFYLIKKNETLIYGFFKNDTIAFAVELQGKKIQQSSGKYNVELNDEENNIVQKWYKSCFGDVVTKEK